MENYYKPNCNRCSIKCGGMRREYIYCVSFIPPKEGWSLAELALAHPQSLNDALKALPFEVNLDFYLR